jgi:hypothetical protein
LKFVPNGFHVDVGTAYAVIKNKVEDFHAEQGWQLELEVDKPGDWPKEHKARSGHYTGKGSFHAEGKHR